MVAASACAAVSGNNEFYRIIVLSNPARAWRLALLTALTSVVGGIFGYGIGWATFVALGYLAFR